MEAKLSVFFESPFWVAIFERVDERGYSTARHVFGAEPSTAELYLFLMNSYDRLNFTEYCAEKAFTRQQVNPKRMQREINRSQREGGRCKWAYNELKRQYEEQKREAGVSKKELKVEMERQKFILKEQKRKKRRRGH